MLGRDLGQSYTRLVPEPAPALGLVACLPSGQNFYETNENQKRMFK